MNINDVHHDIKKHKRRKRIGRGTGSGTGKTAARGHKGQGSRAGFSHKSTFEGGRMPLFRRIPKRGFTNRWAKKIAVVNVDDLEVNFEAGAEVTLEALRQHNLAKGQCDELKILGDGELSKKLKVSAHRFSKSAREKIEKAGGEVVVLPGRKPVENPKRGQQQASSEAAQSESPAAKQPADEKASKEEPSS